MTAFAKPAAFVLRQQLKAQLQAHRLTARQLSLHVGIPYTTIANWLEGRMPRNIDQLKQVASYLGLSIDALCYGALPSETEPNGISIGSVCEGLTGLFEIKLHKILKV